MSSGAVGVGCQRLKLSARPRSLAQKQALAAIGQVYLIRYWEDFLDALGLVGEACLQSLTADSALRALVTVCTLL